jgi:hypothetical protein
MGFGRAGWYSFDLVDNLARSSAERIMPEHQDPVPGDLVPISPDGKMGFYVKDVRIGSWMLWWDNSGGMTFAWGLYRADGDRTRLVTRVRMRDEVLSPAILFDLALDVGDFVMMRQSMLGIKARAEGRSPLPFAVQTLELLAWLAAFVCFVIAEVRLARRPDWARNSLIAAAGAGLTILLVITKPPIWVDVAGAAGLATFLFLSRPGKHAP